MRAQRFVTARRTQQLARRIQPAGPRRAALERHPRHCRRADDAGSASTAASIGSVSAACTSAALASPLTTIAPVHAVCGAAPGALLLADGADGRRAPQRAAALLAERFDEPTQREQRSALLLDGARHHVQVAADGGERLSVPGGHEGQREG